ncbi:MAG: GrpB family protein [Deltaproteobacteria bacterium]
MEVDEPIHLEPYNSTWASWFAADAEELKGVLGQRLQALEHFGSTAVPSMLAKPVVDILLAPSQWPASDGFLSSVQALGYEHLGNAGVPGREYLRRRALHDTNLAVVSWQGAHWRNNLAIRDFLRANPQFAVRYSAVKRQAWERGATALLAYSQAKASFMAELASAALGSASSPMVVAVRQES